MRHQLKFVVTGCGRSGTGYAAKLFRELGYKCGHEAIFGFKGTRDLTVEADSSWLAAPALALDPQTPEAFDLKILHQVRNPVHVIRSMMGVGSFKAPLNAYGQFAALIMATHSDTRDTPLVQCMEFWLHWNTLLERMTAWRNVMRYRVEDMPVPSILNFLTHGGDVMMIAATAIKKVKTNVNSRQRDDNVEWERLPKSDLKDKIMEMAIRYGYTQEQVETA